MNKRLKPGYSFDLFMKTCKDGVAEFEKPTKSMCTVHSMLASESGNVHCWP